MLGASKPAPSSALPATWAAAVPKQPATRDVPRVNEEEIAAYCEMLFGYVDFGRHDTIRLRGIGEKGTPKEGKHSEPKSLDPHINYPEQLAEHARRWARYSVGTFLVPAVMSRDDDKEESVRLFTTLLVDLDSGDTDAKLAHLERYLGPATMVVRSGGQAAPGKPKRHAYWRLKEPTAEVKRVGQLREAMARAVGDDPSFKRITQIIRVPGTVHGKDGKASLCSIERTAAAEYELEEIAEAIATMPAMAPHVLEANRTIGTVGSILDFARPEHVNRTSAALTAPVRAGGADGATRWDSFNTVAGHYLHCVRRGEYALDEAAQLAYGWMQANMAPPWPAERFEREWHGLLSADIRNHGPMGAVPRPAGGERASVGSAGDNVATVHNVRASQALEIEPSPFETLDRTAADGGLRIAPPFPVALLGEFWADFARHAAEAAGAPLDYVSMALLVGASAVLGNTRRASPWQGWCEPPHLWAALVGLPSAGKTPAQQQVLDLLRSIEELRAREYPESRADWEKARAVAEAVHQRWREDVTDALKRGVPAPDRPAQAVMPPEPVKPRIIVSDVTVEKCARIMAVHPRGLLLHRDELAGWLGMMNKYGGQGDRAFWLETYNGKRFVVDRVSLGDPLEVPYASAAVLGSIQPARLNDTILGEVDDGMSARFLWCWPDAIQQRRPKARPIKFERTELEALTSLAALEMLPAAGPNSVPLPMALPLTEAAIEAFCLWRERNAASERECGERLASHYGKHPGYVLRLALTLEHLWWCAKGGEAPTIISKAAVSAAIMLVDDYFKPMARRVFGDAVLPEAERKATTLARWILKDRPARINVRELQRQVRLPGLRKASDVEAAISVLIEAGWLRKAPVERRQSAGQPRKDYEVNPELWAAPAGENRAA